MTMRVGMAVEGVSARAEAGNASCSSAAADAERARSAVGNDHANGSDSTEGVNGAAYGADEMGDGMTLMDLLRLLGRFKKPVVAVPVACTLVVAVCALVLGADVAKYAIVALLASLFAVVAAVVAWDSWKMPVRGMEQLEGVSGLYVLGRVPDADRGERLFSNLMFVASDRAGVNVNAAAAGEDARDELSVAVVPVGEPADAKLVADALLVGHARAGRGCAVNATACAPFSEGMDAAWAAREADAVVVVAREWSDSVREVEGTLRELMLAGATVAGFALVAEGVRD